MTERMFNVAYDVRRLESNVSQLSTAIHWLSSSLAQEARVGRSFGLAMAAQMDGPVRALSVALMNLNDGVAGMLAAAEEDLREQAQPIDPGRNERLLEMAGSLSQAVH
jgi:hypothetical protein